jgi:hypothetical protein
MEFRRLAGTVIFETPWPTQSEPVTEFREQAKGALTSFYEGNEHFCWPKKEFASNAPEEVRIIDEHGFILGKYDIRELLADTKRTLEGE